MVTRTRAALIRVVTALWCAASAASGCNALFGLSPTTLGTPDGSGAGGGGGGAGGSDAGLGGHDGQQVANCKGTTGPTPVNIDGMFCMDSTMVTNAQYQEFLIADASVPVTLSDACNKWKTSHQPAQGWPFPAGWDQHPVVYVDYCDAYAYCKWANKRLCGELGTTFPQFSDYLSAESYYACSGGAMNLAYPYGQTYDASRCQTGSPAVVNAPVMIPNCTTAYPGLYDLGADIAFWLDLCLPNTDPPGPHNGSDDTCRESPPPADVQYGVASSYRCDNQYAFDPRNQTADALGIRCCSDVDVPPL